MFAAAIIFHFRILIGQMSMRNYLRYRVNQYLIGLALFNSFCVLGIIILMCIGIVESGVFVNMAEKVYFGTSDGSVQVLDKP